MKTDDLDARIRKYFPDYLPMGVGMAEIMEMGAGVMMVAQRRSRTRS